MRVYYFKKYVDFPLDVNDFFMFVETESTPMQCNIRLYFKCFLGEI